MNVQMNKSNNGKDSEIALQEKQNMRNFYENSNDIVENDMKFSPVEQKRKKSHRISWMPNDSASSLNTRNMQHTQDLAKHMSSQNEQNLNDQVFLEKFSTRSFHQKKNDTIIQEKQNNFREKIVIPSSFSLTNENTDISLKKKTAKRLNNSIYKLKQSKTANCSLSNIKEEQTNLSKKTKQEPKDQVSVSDIRIDLIHIEKKNAIKSTKNSFSNIMKKKMPNSSKDIDSNDSVVEKSESIYSFYFNIFLIKFNFFVMSPDDNCMFLWLFVITACFLYNIWIIIARQSFENLQIIFSGYWKILDGISDSLYLLDILIQFRTGYLEQGLLVYDSKKLAKNYIRSQKFLLDIFSILPLELLELHLGYTVPMLRFPRFFKIYRMIEWYQLTESRTLYPNVVRVTNLTHILFLLGHWFAGFYFLISKAEGFKGHWSYPEPIDEFAQLPRMYLRCLYWSTLTLTTIGDLPPPETNWQWLKEMSNYRYLFSIFVHYLAVFVIALIVGQVGNVITNRNASRVEFERLLDGAKQYMRNHNVPQCMQKRVQRWYDYSWSRGRMNGSGDIHSIGLLPDKLKTELALHVNLETLRKVTIFHECQPEFLHDLVLKMRAYIFTPGDMICRKGEVAREMFIIADGVLEVIGEKGQVFTKMYSGDFFGEIGILNIEGATNKRTADVRSVGYAELFSLSKEDVLSAVRDYPEAEGILLEYGKRRLNQNFKKKNVDISLNKNDDKEDVSSIDSLKVRDETEKVLSYMPNKNRDRSSSLFGQETLLLDNSNISHNMNILGFSENCKSYLNESINKDYFKSQLKNVQDKLKNPTKMNLDVIKNILTELEGNLTKREDSLDDKQVLNSILC